MNRELLRAEAIVKRRGGAVVLNHAELNVFEGEGVALLGRNSAGKSTLASILSGESLQDKGRILIDDELSSLEQRRNIVGLVHENSTLIEELTLSENLFAVKRNAPGEIFYRKIAMEQLSQELLQNFEVDWDVCRPVKEIPLNIQHICRILKALINGKKLVVLDEICESYTQKDKEFLISVIEKLNERGVAVLYITNKLDEIARKMQRTVIIRDGYCVKCFWGQPCNIDKVKNLMFGYKFENALKHKQEQKEGTPLLISNLGKRQFLRGTSLGIVDLDGTMDEYFGRMLPKWRQEVNGSLALLDSDSPESEWIESMSILDNMLLPILKRVRGPLGVISGSMTKVFQKECIEKFPWIASVINETPRSITQEKRLQLLFYRWEIQNSALIIMNRLASGTDDIGKQVIYDGIESFLRAGAAVLFFSGNFNEIINICDVALLIAKGNVSGEIDCKDENATEQYSIILKENR